MAEKKISGAPANSSTHTVASSPERKPSGEHTNNGVRSSNGKHSQAIDQNKDRGESGFIGREASCRLSGILFQEIKAKNLPEEHLAKDTGTEIEHLKSKYERISWDSFCRLMINAGEIWTDEEMLQIGERFITSSWIRPFNITARLLTDVTEFYRWTAQPKIGAINLLATCIKTKFRELSPGRLELDVSVDEGYQNCRLFFVATCGVFQAIPRVLGMKTAAVKMEEHPRGAHYQIELGQKTGRDAEIGFASGAMDSTSNSNPPFHIKKRDILAHLAENVRTQIELERYAARQSRTNARLREEMEERKRAEHTLLIQKKLYRAITENSSDIIIIVDRTSVCRYVSPSVTNVLGYNLEDWLGADPAPMIHSESIGAFTKAINDARGREKVSIKIQMIKIRHQNGEWRCFEGLFTSMMFVPEVDGIVVNLRDITYRKFAEDALVRSEENYRNLVELLPAGIAIHSEGTIMYINPTGMKLFGADRPEQVIGEQALRFIHPDYHQLASERIAKINNGIKLDSIEQKFVQLNGKVFDVEVAGTQIMFSGKPAILGIFWDITVRKQAEEKVRKLNEELEAKVQERTKALTVANKELEAFAYTVSHDLQAPLRHISGFADLLLANAETSLDEKDKYYLHKIANSALQMSDLIDDLLSYSRLGSAALRISTVNVRELVDEIILDSGTELQDRSLNWVVGNLPGVQGDKTQIRQVFSNLIENSIKFTRTRANAVIEIGSINGDNGEIIFFVRDNGVGFDMQLYNKVFGVFQRLHAADEFEGTGIGLANVRRIVQRHGGQVWAEGKVDEGAVFYCTLPGLQA